jgi:hypothetical protein
MTVEYMPQSPTAESQAANNAYKPQFSEKSQGQYHDNGRCNCQSMTDCKWNERDENYSPAPAM